MRTTQIGGVTIEYPEELVWKQDSNILTVSGLSNIGAMVVIANPLQEYFTLEYYSEQNQLVFVLDDAIKALFNDNISSWYCKVTPYSGDTPVGQSFNFNFRVLDGKSFSSRSHGISSTIYIYSPEELQKVFVYSPQQGVAVCDQWGYNCYYGLNTFNLTGPIRYTGEYTLCLRDSNETPPSASISGVDAITPQLNNISFSVLAGHQTEEIYGGDVFDENKVIFPVCHKIIYQGHCNDYNFGEIRYTDLDGMIRYLGGKVTEDNDDVKTEDYFTTTSSVYKKTPNRYILSHEKTIKLNLIDIEKDAYPHDLLYSQDIYYKSWNGEYVSCSLKTSKFTRKDDDTYDIELEIIVSR